MFLFLFFTVDKLSFLPFSSAEKLVFYLFYVTLVLHSKIFFDMLYFTDLGKA